LETHAGEPAAMPDTLQRADILQASAQPVRRADAAHDTLTQALGPLLWLISAYFPRVAAEGPCSIWSTRRTPFASGAGLNFGLIVAMPKMSLKSTPRACTMR